jgi:hypothetical protein
MALVSEVVIFVEELDDMNVSSLHDSCYGYGPNCRWEEQSRQAPLPKYPFRRLSKTGNNPKSEPVAERGHSLPPSRPTRRKSLCDVSFNEKHEDGPYTDRERCEYVKIGKSRSHTSLPTLPVPGLMSYQAARQSRRRQRQKPRRVVASFAA